VGPRDPHDRAIRRRGALEEAAAAEAVVRTARELGLVGARTAERVFAAGRRRDPAAVRAIEVEASRLALAIASIAAVLDPEVVVLGGGVARSGDLLIEPIERELHLLVPFRPRIVVSALGDDAVLHGAVATALEAGRQELFRRSRSARTPRPA
jgi:predicted NBD/HSP70 family sugar kinase